jgi:uncharacterized membrane protein
VDETEPQMDGDEYQTVQHVSWLERLLESFVGVLLGILLVIVAVVLLFINEGNTDFSKVAQTAMVVSPQAANPAAQGKLVSLTGPITAAPPIGDNLYLKPGNYVAISRTVEMYAWKEEKDTKTQKNLGGSETRVTTYRYTKAWSDQPESSAQFQKPNYRNPSKSIDNQVLTASSAKLGRYNVDMSGLKDVVNKPSSCVADTPRYTGNFNSGINLPKGSRLQLTTQNLLPTKVQVVGDYLFQGAGTPQAPQIGDLRICYSVLPSQSTVTLFGQVQGDRMIPAPVGNQEFLRLFPGTRDGAIAEFKSEYQLWLWGFRLLGFILMWIGLWLLVNPISVVLSVIPFLGDLSDFFNQTASFIVAFILSAVTIFVSSLIHQPWVLAASITVTLVALFLSRFIFRSLRVS